MGDYTHILVPTDFSKPSEVAAARGAELAKRYGGRLSVLHVVDYVPPGYVRAEVPQASSEKLVERAGGALAEWVKRVGIAPDNKWVGVGSAKRQIIDRAKKERVDLIVMGTHGHGGLTLLLGSTTTSVIHEAPCDVLAVRAKP